LTFVSGITQATADVNFVSIIEGTKIFCKQEALSDSYV